MICSSGGGLEESDAWKLRDVVLQLSMILGEHHKTLTERIDNCAARHDQKLDQMFLQFDKQFAVMEDFPNVAPPKRNTSFDTSKSFRPSVTEDIRGADKALCSLDSEDMAHPKAKPAREEKSVRLQNLKNMGGDSIYSSTDANEIENPKRFSISTNSVRFKFRSLVGSTLFEVMCGIIILVNALIIGVETEYLTSHETTPAVLEITQHALNTWFFIEMLLRMYVAGPRVYMTSREDRKWNLFDLVLVALWIIDLTVASFKIQGVTMTRIFRAMRLVRLLRVLRIFRVVRAVIEFRKMVYAFTSSMTTLMWSLLLLVFEMYFFAVAFVQGVNHYRFEEPDQNVDGLYHRFGSMGRAYYSLYMAVSNGMSWGYIVDPLNSLHSFYRALFLVYISITMFGVLNVLISVFVESALQSTAHHRDLLVQEKQKRTDMYLKHIKDIFRQIDADNSGAVSLPEIELIFAHGEMNELLEALEITAFDARSMFKLLDRDGSGCIDIDEFCHGCLRMKGEAKSFDIQCLIYESQRLIMKTAGLTEHFTETIIELEETMRTNTDSVKKSVQKAFNRRDNKSEINPPRLPSEHVPSENQQSLVPLAVEPSFPL